MAYPERGNIPNGWQIAGQALTQAGGLVGDLNDQLTKQRMAYEDMVQKRAAALLAKQKEERETKLAEEEAARRAEEDKRKQWEFEQKQKAADKAQKFRDEVKNGKALSPTAASNPSIYQVSAPSADGSGLPSKADLAALEPDAPPLQGGMLPSQSVQGEPNWGRVMMDKAVQSAADTGGRVRYDRGELADLGLQYGVLDAKDYLSSTKEKPADFFNDPALLADFRIKSQDPAFQKIAEGYSKDPAKYGPILQSWAAHNGYAGQRWWNTELDNMYKQPPLRVVSPNTMSPEDVQYWGQMYAQGKIDPASLSSMFSSRGGNKSSMLREIYKAAQAINPDVNPVDDQGGANASKDKVNRRLVGTINNVKSRMSRLMELSNSVDRTRFPTLNDYLISGERGVGNIQAELLALNEDLMGEELSPVFGQGAAASDAKLHLAQQVSGIKRLSPVAAAAKLKELEDALDARKASITGTFGRYAVPEKSPTASEPPPTPARGKFKPVDASTAADYLKRAGGDRKKAKSLLAKDGYNVNG